MVRVRKPDVAEDLVQETFLAAVRGYEKFGGLSSERSRLVGILKNKIVDHFRKLGRETSFTDMEFLSEEFSEKFVPIGFWNHDLGPHEWKPEPDEVVQLRRFTFATKASSIARNIITTIGTVASSIAGSLNCWRAKL